MRRVIEITESGLIIPPGIRSAIDMLYIGDSGLAVKSNQYTTEFTLTENPISEGGMWARAANSMNDVRTTGGVALGTQTDDTYDDSYAILQGDWGADYEIEAVVYRHASLPNSVDPSHELELNFRVSDGASAYVGYEMMFMSSNAAGACGFWTAPQTVAVMTPFENGSYVPDEVVDGDVIKARIVGNTISRWHNDILIDRFDITDQSPVYNTGNPAIGLFTRPTQGGNTNYFGFKSVKITKL